jgi:hypothetical protein
MLYGFDMSRAFLLGLVVLTAACGGDKTSPQQDSVCGSPVPPPACATACDPAAGASTSCPVGFHCASTRKCDSLCTANGNECGDGYQCTIDGFCISKGPGGGTDDPGTEPDAFCPSVEFTAKKTIPSIQLLIDRSGSMEKDFKGKTADNNSMDPTRHEKFTTEQDALVGQAGVVTQLADQVYFGASMYPSDSCPGLFSVGRALNNKKAISDLLAAHGPGGNTPTADSINSVVQDFATNKPPVGSPPVIVLATDGLPNQCNAQGDDDPVARQATVDAAAAAFAHGIPLFLLSVGTIDPVFEQAVANAGAGAPQGTNAKPFKATSPAELSAAFQEIIRGVVSCDLTLNGKVEADAASTGVVVLNDVTLTYMTDWTLDANGMILHLLGTACTALKNSADPKIKATFACGGGTIFF